MTYEDVQRVLYHSRAQGTAKVLLLGIADHVGVAGAWPSSVRLGFLANVKDDSHVRRLVRDLEALGELTILRRPGRSSQYVLTCPCPPECSEIRGHALVHSRGPQTPTTRGPQTPGPTDPGSTDPDHPGPTDPNRRGPQTPRTNKEPTNESTVVPQSVTTGPARGVVDLDAVRARIRGAKAGTS